MNLKHRSKGDPLVLSKFPCYCFNVNNWEIRWCSSLKFLENPATELHHATHESVSSCMEIIRKAIAGCALDDITSLGNGVVRRCYRFKPGFIGFSGHFPGYPILPAFIQVITALALMEEVKGHELILESLEKAKFYIEIKPDTTIEVTCRERSRLGKPTIEANLRVDGKLASAFSLVYQAP